MTAFKNPTPVAVCLVELVSFELRTRQLIAIKRGTPPRVGGLVFPGGYIDEGESAEQAASRELKEETGLVVAPNQWQALQTKVTPDNKLLIFLVARVFMPANALTSFVPNKEALELTTVTYKDTLAFPTHDEVLKSRIWF